MTRNDHPICRLEEKDLNMVLAFVLESGSIKALASRYGVSYPTMRSRLDRLIERVRQTAAERDADPLSDFLAGLIARGGINPTDARRIRDLHRLSVNDGRGAPASETAPDVDYEGEVP